MTAIITGLSFILPVLYPGIAFAGNLLEEPARYSPVSTTAAPIEKAVVLNTFPHDPGAFTQGLVFHQGCLYESTGLYGQSTLRKKALRTGKTVKAVRLPVQYFGEGIAILGAKIYQLTYQNETGFIYNPDTLKQIGRFKYRGEGWGLTTDGKHLIMSNGTSVITFRTPDSFSTSRIIQVRDGDKPVDGINELEFIRGEIWANIYMKNAICRISPETGKVLGWLDMNALFQKLDPKYQIDVLNGIAYDPKADRVFVTGKLWPTVFEIKKPSVK